VYFFFGYGQRGFIGLWLHRMPAINAGILTCASVTLHLPQFNQPWLSAPALSGKQFYFNQLLPYLALFFNFTAVVPALQFEKTNRTIHFKQYMYETICNNPSVFYIGNYSKSTG
jgi:hypothetical protein